MKPFPILGCSLLAALRPGHDYRPALDEAHALGFTLARTFCGDLPWAGQELQHVYDRLPGYLDALRERAMHGYLAYVTEAGAGFNLARHVGELEAIAAGRENVLREVGNEAPHATQGGRLPPERCADLAAAMRGPVGYSADIDDDEGQRYAGGAFVPWHRNRSRDKWNDVRRQNEGRVLQEATDKPVLDQEGKGAAETSEPGKRESDPAYFFAQAALAKLFNLGGSVFHSSSGLLAQPLGPNERRCAEAFLAGWQAIPEGRYAYRNAGHENSPVRSARFNDGDMGKEGCTRAYSGIVDGHGYTVELGCVGPTTIGWDWSRRDGIGEMAGVRVYAVAE